MEEHADVLRLTRDGANISQYDISQPPTARGTRVTEDLDDDDYRTLAEFRRTLREFTHFSEKAAQDANLTPQQHQALLAIRAANGLTVGELADQLMLRPHSATGLADRLARLGLIERLASEHDRRRVELVPTTKAGEVLRTLSSAHRIELRRLRPLLTGLLGKL
jgi:DNA-binding MarR family transcriptional regulator